MASTISGSTIGSTSTTSSSAAVSLSPAGGVLSTTWTPTGSNCDSTFIGANPQNTWLQRGNIEGDPAACLAPGWSRETPVYYSPGVCPYGFVSTWGQVTNGISTATCCPSGYSYRTPVATVDFNYCGSDIEAEIYVTLESVFYTGDHPSAITSTLIKAGQSVGAFGVVVQRQSTDPTWDTVAAVTTATTTSSSTSTSAPSSSSTSSESSGGSDSGLSTGAKAGIGVGVSLGVLLILSIVFLAFRIGRSKRSGQDEQQQQQQQRQAAALSPDTVMQQPSSIGTKTPGTEGGDAWYGHGGFTAQHQQPQQQQQYIPHHDQQYAGYPPAVRQELHAQSHVSEMDGGRPVAAEM